MADSLAAFRHPHVARFALGRFFSAMATTCVSVAVGWELYERTSSAWALGFVGLSQIVPVVGLALIAGIASDRFPRKYLAVLAHLALCTAAIGLFFLTYNHGPIPAYYALLVLQGIGTAFRGPAVAPILPQLVPVEDLENANAWFTSSFELAAIVGPAVAGALIALAGSAWAAFAFAAVSHLAFITILLSLPYRPAAMSGAALRLRDLFVGIRFVFSAKMFLGAITLDLFAVLLGGATALLPVYVRDILHEGPHALGWLRSAPAMGALLMAVIQTRMKPWKRPGATMMIAVAGFGAATIVFGLSRSYALSFAMLFITGACDNISVVVRNTLEQALTPDALRGRVSAINYVFIGLSNEMGAFESGATAALFGPIISVVGGGIGTLVVVSLVAWRFRELVNAPPLRTLKPLPVLTTAVDEPKPLSVVA